LWNFEDASIKVFEKESAFLDDVLFDLEDLNKVDVSIVAEFVFKRSQLTQYNVVLFACLSHNPLQVLKRHLIVLRNEKRFVVA